MDAPPVVASRLVVAVVCPDGETGTPADYKTGKNAGHFKPALTIEDQIAELGRLTVTQLRQKYVEVFGEESRSNHKQFLFRRIAWRIQALAEGGLSERARRRALEIANDADLRIRAPKTEFGQDSETDSSSVTAKGGRPPSIRGCPRRGPTSNASTRAANHREGPGGWVRVRGPDLPVPQRDGREVTGDQVERLPLLRLPSPAEATNGKE